MTRPAVNADSDAKSDNEWTVIRRPDGASQWAYRARPLYTYIADEVGQAPTGASPLWLVVGSTTQPAEMKAVKPQVEVMLTGLPAEVKEVGGTWRAAQDGRPLYWNRKDPPGGTSCVAGCAVAWPPVLAPQGIAGSGDWTIIKRPDGARQWAFKGSAVYTCMADDPDGAPTGLSATWTKAGAPVVAAAAAVVAAPVVAAVAAAPQKLAGAFWVDDPNVTTKPRLVSALKLADWYPAASMRKKESGTTGVEQCIDVEGRPMELTVVKSSGFPLLDEATVKMLERARYQGARVGKTGVAVCGQVIEIVWNIK